MREIRFRAWDKMSLTMLMPETFELRQEEDNGFHAFRFHDDGEFAPLELMQFTGLKDKNRNAIYEGDIVTRLESRFKVVWCEEYGAFKLYRIDVKDDGYFRHMQFYDTETELEIIGNIYENHDANVLGDEQ